MIPLRTWHIAMIAIVGGVVGTWLMRGIARRLGIVNHPNPIVPQHRRAVAYLGGVGVMLGIAAAVGATLVVSPTFEALRHTGPLSAWALGAVAFLVLGIADDLRAFSPGPKFALQLVIATVAALLGVRCPFTSFMPVNLTLSVLLILTAVNAFNLTDVCDGLLGSLCVVMFMFIGLLRPEVMPVAAAVAGACAGFLLLNAPPASIFLGDAGSHLLGFLAAALLLSGPEAGGRWPYSAQAALVLGVPLFELSFLIIVRRRKGLAWWRGSPDHFALRLQAAGFSRGQTDLIACSAAFLLGLCAIGLRDSSQAARVAILAGVMLALGICWRALLKWEVRPAHARPAGSAQTVPSPAAPSEDLALPAAEA